MGNLMAARPAVTPRAAAHAALAAQVTAKGGSPFNHLSASLRDADVSHLPCPPPLTSHVFAGNAREWIAAIPNEEFFGFFS